jgi:hypothetical protein
MNEKEIDGFKFVIITESDIRERRYLSELERIYLSTAEQIESGTMPTNLPFAGMRRRKFRLLLPEEKRMLLDLR